MKTSQGRLGLAGLMSAFFVLMVGVGTANAAATPNACTTLAADTPSAVFDCYVTNFIKPAPSKPVVWTLSGTGSRSKYNIAVPVTDDITLTFTASARLVASMWADPVNMLPSMTADLFSYTGIKIKGVDLTAAMKPTLGSNQTLTGTRTNGWSMVSGYLMLNQNHTITTILNGNSTTVTNTYYAVASAAGAVGTKSLAELQLSATDLIKTTFGEIPINGTFSTAPDAEGNLYLSFTLGGQKLTTRVSLIAQGQPQIFVVGDNDKPMTGEAGVRALNALRDAVQAARGSLDGAFAGAQVLIHDARVLQSCTGSGASSACVPTSVRVTANTLVNGVVKGEAVYEVSDVNETPLQTRAVQFKFDSWVVNAAYLETAAGVASGQAYSVRWVLTDDAYHVEVRAASGAVSTLRFWSTPTFQPWAAPVVMAVNLTDYLAARNSLYSLIDTELGKFGAAITAHQTSMQFPTSYETWKVINPDGTITLKAVVTPTQSSHDISGLDYVFEKTYDPRTSTVVSTNLTTRFYQFTALLPGIVAPQDLNMALASMNLEANVSGRLLGYKTGNPQITSASRQGQAMTVDLSVAGTTMRLAGRPGMLYGYSTPGDMRSYALLNGVDYIRSLLGYPNSSLSPTIEMIDQSSGAFYIGAVFSEYDRVTNRYIPILRVGVEEKPGYYFTISSLETAGGADVISAIKTRAHSSDVRASNIRFVDGLLLFHIEVGGVWNGGREGSFDPGTGVVKLDPITPEEVRRTIAEDKFKQVLYLYTADPLDLTVVDHGDDTFGYRMTVGNAVFEIRVDDLTRQVLPLALLDANGAYLLDAQPLITEAYDLVNAAAGASLTIKDMENLGVVSCELGMAPCPTSNSVHTSGSFLVWAWGTDGKSHTYDIVIESGLGLPPTVFSLKTATDSGKKDLLDGIRAKVGAFDHLTYFHINPYAKEGQLEFRVLINGVERDGSMDFGGGNVRISGMNDDEAILHAAEKAIMDLFDPTEGDGEVKNPTMSIMGYDDLGRAICKWEENPSVRVTVEPSALTTKVRVVTSQGLIFIKNLDSIIREIKVAEIFNNGPDNSRPVIRVTAIEFTEAVCKGMNCPADGQLVLKGAVLMGPQGSEVLIGLSWTVQGDDSFKLTHFNLPDPDGRNLISMTAEKVQNASLYKLTEVNFVSTDEITVVMEAANSRLKIRFGSASSGYTIIRHDLITGDKVESIFNSLDYIVNRKTLDANDVVRKDEEFDQYGNLLKTTHFNTAGIMTWQTWITWGGAEATFGYAGILNAQGAPIKVEYREVIAQTGQTLVLKKWDEKERLVCNFDLNGTIETTYNELDQVVRVRTESRGTDTVTTTVVETRYGVNGAIEETTTETSTPQPSGLYPNSMPTRKIEVAWPDPSNPSGQKVLTIEYVYDSNQIDQQYALLETRVYDNSDPNRWAAPRRIFNLGGSGEIDPAAIKTAYQAAGFVPQYSPVDTMALRRQALETIQAIFNPSSDPDLQLIASGPDPQGNYHFCWTAGSTFDVVVSPAGVSLEVYLLDPSGSPTAIIVKDEVSKVRDYLMNVFQDEIEVDGIIKAVPPTDIHINTMTNQGSTPCLVAPCPEGIVTQVTFTVPTHGEGLVFNATFQSGSGPKGVVKITSLTRNGTDYVESFMKRVQNLGGPIDPSGAGPTISYIKFREPQIYFGYTHPDDNSIYELILSMSQEEEAAMRQQAEGMIQKSFGQDSAPMLDFNGYDELGHGRFVWQDYLYVGVSVDPVSLDAVLQVVSGDGRVFIGDLVPILGNIRSATASIFKDSTVSFTGLHFDENVFDAVPRPPLAGQVRVEGSVEIDPKNDQGFDGPTTRIGLTWDLQQDGSFKITNMMLSDGRDAIGMIATRVGGIADYELAGVLIEGFAVTVTMEKRFGQIILYMTSTSQNYTITEIDTESGIRKVSTYNGTGLMATTVYGMPKSVLIDSADKTDIFINQIDPGELFSVSTSFDKSVPAHKTREVVSNAKGERLVVRVYYLGSDQVRMEIKSLNSSLAQQRAWNEDGDLTQYVWVIQDELVTHEQTWDYDPERRVVKFSNMIHDGQGADAQITLTTYPTTDNDSFILIKTVQRLGTNGTVIETKKRTAFSISYSIDAETGEVLETVVRFQEDNGPIRQIFNLGGKGKHSYQSILDVYQQPDFVPQYSQSVDDRQKAADAYNAKFTPTAPVLPSEFAEVVSDGTHILVRGAVEIHVSHDHSVVECFVRMEDGSLMDADYFTKMVRANVELHVAGYGADAAINSIQQVESGIRVSVVTAQSGTSVEIDIVGSGQISQTRITYGADTIFDGKRWVYKSVDTFDQSGVEIGFDVHIAEYMPGDDEPFDEWAAAYTYNEKGDFLTEKSWQRILVDGVFETHEFTADYVYSEDGAMAITVSAARHDASGALIERETQECRTWHEGTINYSKSNRTTYESHDLVRLVHVNTTRYDENMNFLDHVDYFDENHVHEFNEHGQRIRETITVTDFKQNVISTQVIDYDPITGRKMEDIEAENLKKYGDIMLGQANGKLNEVFRSMNSETTVLETAWEPDYLEVPVYELFPMWDARGNLYFKRVQTSVDQIIVGWHEVTREVLVNTQIQAPVVRNTQLDSLQVVDSNTNCIMAGSECEPGNIIGVISGSLLMPDGSEVQFKTTVVLNAGEPGSADGGMKRRISSLIINGVDYAQQAATDAGGNVGQKLDVISVSADSSNNVIIAISLDGVDQRPKTYTLNRPIGLPDDIYIDTTPVDLEPPVVTDDYMNMLDGMHQTLQEQAEQTADIGNTTFVNTVATTNTDSSEEASK